MSSVEISSTSVIILLHLLLPFLLKINQLEKDKDVTAQAQAIAVLETLPQLPFSVVNALSNFLSDSKVFFFKKLCARLKYFFLAQLWFATYAFLFLVTWIRNFTFIIQGFWRVRIQAAYALAYTSSEVYSFFCFYFVVDKCINCVNVLGVWILILTSWRCWDWGRFQSVYW